MTFIYLYILYIFYISIHLFLPNIKCPIFNKVISKLIINIKCVKNIYNVGDIPNLIRHGIWNQRLYLQVIVKYFN